MVNSKGHFVTQAGLLAGSVPQLDTNPEATDTYLAGF